MLRIDRQCARIVSVAQVHVAFYRPWCSPRWRLHDAAAGLRFGAAETRSRCLAKASALLDSNASAVVRSSLRKPSVLKLQTACFSSLEAANCLFLQQDIYAPAGSAQQAPLVVKFSVGRLSSSRRLRVELHCSQQRGIMIVDHDHSIGQLQGI